MSLPLIAVPALAIVGIPSAGSEEASGEEAGVDIMGVPSGLGEETSTHTHGDQADAPPFGDIQNAGEDDEAVAGREHVSANSATDRSQMSPTSGFEGAAANAALGLTSDTAKTETDAACCHEDHAHSHEDHPDDHHHDHGQEHASTTENETNPFLNEETSETADSSEAGESSQDSRQWEAALHQLRELGIKRFHLTNSELPGQFFFCCSLRTSRNILQRFEAEASTPVAAAQDVIAQVESWQNTR